MAWLTTLDPAKRIVRERKKDPLYSYTQSGSLTEDGGLTFTQTVVGYRTITTYEYTGINANFADALVDDANDTEGTKEAYFQYHEAGGGALFHKIETRVLI
mgnify:CR=1 FL=1